MIGILVQLAISWVIIWLYEKGNLSFLGLKPTATRTGLFTLFFILSGSFCAIGFLLKISIGQLHWHVNPKLSYELIMSGIWWNIKSVLFEELIFRGVLLYILIRKAGSWPGIIISSAAFGIYHWFSFGVLGDPVMMLIVFLITGVMGIVLAYGYARTFSLYIPVGIHLGWNVMQIFVFSGGPIGDGVVIVEEPFRTDSYWIYGFVNLFPITALLVIDFLILKQAGSRILSKINVAG